MINIFSSCESYLTPRPMHWTDALARSPQGRVVESSAGHTVAETTFPQHSHGRLFLGPQGVLMKMSGLLVASSTTARWLNASTFLKTIAYQ